jgi:hypothetical protein
MKTLALVTMVFLPPTTVATIFQMPFFHWDTERPISIVDYRFWIYCVTAVPLTITTLAVWWIWSRRQEKFKTKWHNLKTKLAHWETNEIKQENLPGTAWNFGNGDKEWRAPKRTTLEWEEADSHAAAIKVAEIGSSSRFDRMEVDIVAQDQVNGLRSTFKPRWRNQFRFHRSPPLDIEQRV